MGMAESVSASGASVIAYSRGFALLGELFAHGLTAGGRAAWAQVPEAADLVAELSDEAAAEAYTRALQLELAPYESAFCSEDGLLGGECVDALRTLRVRSGLPAEGEVDHLGEELRWLSFLTGASADAARDGVDSAHILELERQVLDQHVLRWLPALVASLRAQANAPALWVLAGDLALALSVARRVTLGGEPAAWALPAGISILEDERAGLRRIAEHLALPVQAGGMFCRSTLVGIGRALDLPAGFGARADLLEGLLRSAAHYGRVPELCGALEQQLVGWEGSWRTLDESGLGALAAPWHARIGATRGILGRLAAPTRPPP
ncbi:MAG: hypothetical protein EXR71_02845 [Myxococcales bacterium]|nr:hypothetical protein [Myxococcales bacterium]